MDIQKTAKAISGVRNIYLLLPKPRSHLEIHSTLSLISVLKEHNGHRRQSSCVPSPSTGAMNFVKEEMAKQSEGMEEIIIAIPCDMETETKERLKCNLPHGIIVTVLEEQLKLLAHHMSNYSLHFLQGY